MPTIRQVYLYEDKDLPKCGWFQGCILCSTITSKTLFFDFKSDEKEKLKYEFYTYLCPPCQRKIKNDKKENENYKIITNDMIFYKFGF